MKLVGANAILRARDEPHSNEPLVEADGTVFHDRSNLERELATIRALVASPDPALCGEGNVRGIAVRASDTIRPAHSNKEIERTIRVSEVDHRLLQCLWKLGLFVLHAHNLCSEACCVKYIITQMRAKHIEQ